MSETTLTREKLFAYLIIDDIQVEEELLNKAKNNDGYSLSKIGIIYYDKKDYAKAIDWFRLSAAQNYSYAYYRLGYIYNLGEGVSVDYNLAMEWYLKAHQNEYVMATNSIGCLYGDGHGVPQDYKVAMKWFLEAAGKGYSGAQYNVGFYYEFGYSVEVDKQYAIEWYERSVEQGYEKAKDAIKRLNMEGIYISDRQKSYIQIEKDNIEMKKKIKSLEDEKVASDKEKENLKAQIKSLEEEVKNLKPNK